MVNAAHKMHCSHGDIKIAVYILISSFHTWKEKEPEYV